MLPELVGLSVWTRTSASPFAEDCALAHIIRAERALDRQSTRA
jgi:hypothetical protein